MGRGVIGGLGFWKTGYWLNWEVPGAVALDPIESTLSGWYFELGPLLYWQAGRFMVQPSLTGLFGSTSLSIEIEGEEEDGLSVYVGLSAGADASVRMWGSTFLTVGYKATWHSSASPSYEVEEGVILVGDLESPRHELYVGLSFKG